VTRNRTLLDLELRLLVARHGKTEIVEALSTIGDVDLAVVDDDLKGYERRRAKKEARGARRKSIEEMVQDANPRPAARRLIGKLARAYDERDFLPELRDVRRFLESRRVSVSTLRSRSDALPTVLRVLAEHDLDELAALDRGRAAGGSDLGVITDQILGSHD